MFRPVAVLLTAKAVSDVGFALDFICLGVFVWVRTGSPLATSMVGLALYAGGIAGGRLGHRRGGQWDRRRVMVTADVARMAALLLLAVAPAAAQLWWLFPAVIVVGLGRAVFEATLSAATPVLAGGRPQLLNSVMSGLKGAALMAGMGLAVVAVPYAGYRGVFALDAASYGTSAAAVLLLPLRLRESPPPAAGGSPAIRAGPPGASGAGRRGAVSWPVIIAAGLALPLAVRGLDALGSASQQVGLPILGSRLSPGNAAGAAGLLWGMWAAGTVAGSVGLRPLLARAVHQAPALVFFVMTAVMSAGFIGVFWLPTWPGRLSAAVVAGAGDALSEICFKQTLQRLPDEQRGGAFGLAQLVINCGFAIGLVITGLAVTPTRIAGWVLLLHGVPLVATLGAAGWSLRAHRLPAAVPGS
jgi:MFS family permease